jgi:hypothetical protein
VSKVREIIQALDACDEDAWKCRTCCAPAEENGEFCMSCRIYWSDCQETDEGEAVAAGVVAEAGS